MEARRKLDEGVQDSSSGLFWKTGKLIALVVQELRISGGTFANWVAKDCRARKAGDGKLVSPAPFHEWHAQHSLLHARAQAHATVNAAQVAA
jgi:hypothetical protein